MPNFELSEGDNLGILEEDLWSSQVDAKEATYEEQGGMQQQKSAFHFESFEEFIKDPQIIKSIIFTILLGICLPLLGAVIFRIYNKMTKNEKTFVDDTDDIVQDIEVDEEFNDFDGDDAAPEEPQPPQLVDAENLDPLAGMYMTDEQRVLINATVNADEHDESIDVVETLSRIQLHGKLATAQLRARTQKMEQSMSDEEREQERIARNEQIAKIFAMMQEQTDKFGIKSADDLSEQLKLYNV